MAPTPLVLPAGHAVHALSAPDTALYVFAVHATGGSARGADTPDEQSAPVPWPAMHRACNDVQLQTRALPEPVPKEPALQAHVEEPTVLVLASGQSVQLDEMAALNVLARQTAVPPP